MHFTLNCKGKLLNITKPIVMGIINSTPDSFFDNSKGNTLQHVEDLVVKMIKDGATILDVGGMSSRPGALPVSLTEEADRVLPVIEMIRNKFPDIIISVDTYRSEVARSAVEAGADIINDISSATLDPGILAVVAKYKTPYIAMHMQGTPDIMQQSPHYENVVLEVFDHFTQKIHEIQQQQVWDIILDVGFGFGKTVEHNFQLLKNLSIFTHFGKPLLAGLSRKSMICKPLKVNPPGALNGTTALHMLALQNGAAILRVHDVKEAVECIKLYEIYKDTAVS